MENSTQYPPRRALITGGASGVGLGVAQALLEKGAYVAIADVDRVRLQKVTQEFGNPKILPIEMDVRSPASVKAGVDACKKAFGEIDTLVNAAGIIRYQLYQEITEKDWDDILDVNLKGVFLCCQAASPLLCESGRGRIVNIGSDASRVGFAYHTHYCASKHGVVGLSKALVGQLAPYNVTVNCVLPVNIPETGMGQEILRWKINATGQTAETIIKAGFEAIPLGRNATVADIVNAIMFFIADESSFITGVALDIDGGAAAFIGTAGASS